MWKYESPIGTLYIQKLEDGRYGLLYKGTIWESCPTPQQEASNVYMHCTGCSEWDALDGKIPNVPNDLSKWHIV